MSILVLGPGAATLVGLTSSAPTPGSILLAVLDGQGLDGVVRAVQAAAHSPWCPLVLASLVPLSNEVLEVFRLRATRLAAVQLRPGEGCPHVALVRSAVAQRRIVSATDFLAYVGARAGTEVRDLVQVVLIDRRNDAVFLRRWARKAGELSPRQWVSLFDLILAISCSLHSNLSQERSAQQLHVAPRSLGAWCARYLGLDWRDTRALGSWEAACELALRRHGYLNEALVRARPRRISGNFVAIQLESCSKSIG